MRSAKRGEQAGQQRVRRRVEPEAGSTRREEVAVLGTADRPAVDCLGVDEARIAETVEVEADRVGVQPEAVGELLGRERRGRRRQLAVHRVAGLVTQGLQHREIHTAG